jgi:GNAT superfamily N-acetyltransferase
VLRGAAHPKGQVAFSMDEPQSFKINFPDYAIRRLQPEDAAILQVLYDRCGDFNWLVEGEPVSLTAAQEDFRSVPQGKSLDDKLVWGIFNLQGEMVGVLDVLRDYPEASTWWVGLLMLAPDARGIGIGRAVMRGFSDYARLQGGKTLMLGVVEENTPAVEFWQKIGFSLLRKTEVRPFGKKMQAVYIMRRQIVPRASKW